jgi:predicted anti-sigma-YlaC factor YlaD
VRTSPFLSEACNRTRQQVSLRLDRELSEFEEALVAAHLAQCSACSAFASDLEGITESLRSAPLIEPALSFELPRRRARVGLAHAGSAAAAAATLVVALGAIAGLRSSPARISGFEVSVAQERISIKEEFLQALERPKARSSVSRRGVEAAEQTALNANEGVR